MTAQEMLNTVTHGSFNLKYLTSSATDLAERLYLDPGESIRFRVDSVEWQDVRPAPPPQYNAAGELESTQPEKDPIEKAGFKIYVRILPGSSREVRAAELTNRHPSLNQAWE